MRRLLVLLLPLVLAAPLAACNWSSDNRFKAETTFLRTVDHVAGSALEIKTHNGRVEAIATPDATDVTIEAVIRARGETQDEADARLAATTLSVERAEDGTLAIEPIFPEPRRGGDGASITVKLPGADGVTLHTSNGSVTARGMSGRLVIDTSNGPVEVAGHRGPAHIDTSNGPIELVDHDGPVSADTSNGPIRMENVKGEVSADTSNGSIVLTLGADQAGPLDLDTSNGSITVGVGPAFTGLVKLGTSNGSVSINDQVGRISSQSLSRTRGHIVVGEGGEASRLDTSNGGITFTIRRS